MTKVKKKKKTNKNSNVAPKPTVAKSDRLRQLVERSRATANARAILAEATPTSD